MTELKLIKDNTEEHAPINPTITYEIIADMGEDGTKTILSSDNFAECCTALNEIRLGEFNKVDLTREELKQVTGISIGLVLTAQELEIITYENEQCAMAEVQAYKVVQ